MDKDLRQTLRLKIKEAFNTCTQEAYPHFHQLLQTKEGYLQAEEMVIQFAIRNSVPVSAAIAQLESELR